MTAREEVLVDVGRGIELCYDQTGDPADPPILLIAGLGQQLHSWPNDFVAALAGRGFRVTRFDNRDAGRSTHMSYPPPNPVAMFRGGDRRKQYHLGDMARDTVGLLDALGYVDAHLVGISMGGMIAQTVAAHHPGRVRTLTSIMSTTGAPRLGRPAMSTWRRMLTSRPPRTRAEAMDRAANMFSHIGSHGFPFDEHAVREYAGIAWDRDPSPAGIVRQLAGIFASGDRTAELGHIDVPTLVIHGDRDRMVHPTGGSATARAIPGARLETITGLGHDLPIGAWGRIIDLITDHATSFAPPPSPTPNSRSTHEQVQRRTISGRTVVITGAASGIGRALAQRLSAHSCPVAIADIDEKGLKETEASLNGPALLRVLDVADAEAQRDFAAEVRDWAPRPIGAVFNNAGVATSSSVLDAVPEDDDWLWNINFHGVVNGTRAFLPILVEQDEGAIVNTSSVFGLVGMPNQSAYCSAKFAVRGFTDSLRQELRGTGVTAINVHPGGINTNIVRNARWRKDPEGRGRSQDQMVQEFAAITLTQPDKAAEIIHRGVEQGKARILVGPDAYLFDTLGRLAPTRYYDLLGRLESVLRRRSQASAAAEVTVS